MKRTIISGLMAAGMLLTGVALNSTVAAEGQEVCAGLDSGKIDTVGDPQTVTMTAPPGNLITRYCIKAGSDESVPEGAVRYFDVKPPQASITVPHPSGKAVSHYSFSYIPEQTTTTTVPPTTVPPTTQPPPEVPTTTATRTTAPPTTGAGVAQLPPTVPGQTPTTQAPAPAPTQLPSTGTSSWVMALMALAALAGGTGLIRLSRRPTD